MHANKHYLSTGLKQFDGKFISDVNLAIKTHEANIRLTGFSHLSELLLTYFVFIKHYRKDTKKYSSLYEKIENIFSMHKNSIYQIQCNDKRVLMYERLKLKLIRQNKKLSDLKLNDYKVKKVKKRIEEIYSNVEYKDTYLKWLLLILVEEDIFNEVDANKVIKSIFKNHNYICCEDAKNDITPMINIKYNLAKTFYKQPPK
jgi:hypothetical protein